MPLDMSTKLVLTPLYAAFVRLHLKYLTALIRRLFRQSYWCPSKISYTFRLGYRFLDDPLKTLACQHRPPSLEQRRLVQGVILLVKNISGLIDSPCCLKDYPPHTNLINWIWGVVCQTSSQHIYTPARCCCRWFESPLSQMSVLCFLLQFAYRPLGPCK